MDLINELSQINQRLASNGIKLRIEQRNNLLNIRGPMPCPKEEGISKRQRISLHLKADPEGLEEAQKILQLVHYQIKHKQFNWGNWSNKSVQKAKKHSVNTANEVIESFKSTFFSDSNRHGSFSGALTTWSSAYLPYMKRLIKHSLKTNRDFDIDLFDQTLSSYSANSRSRQQCATALGALAKHLNIDLPDNWKAKGNGYGLHKAHFRKLPSDELIIEIWKNIPNPKWKLVYGLMATYGLRNHEVFFCDLSGLSNNGDKVIRVLPNTKTGEHQVWPFHPSWNELFGLEELSSGKESLPSIKTDLNKTTLQKVGRRVSEQFNRYKLSITPYDLRHAWAVRTILIGLPDTVAARMMGHSVTIHNRTYHHWITRRDQQKAVDNALSKYSV